jgi:hypothetical protein
VRKLMLLLGVLLLLPVAAHAQHYNLYAGYSYLHLDSSPNSAGLNGWDAAFTDNFASAVGVTVDLGGDYGSINGVSGSSVHSFLFGPQLRFPATVSPFIHGLVGGAHVGGGGASGTSLAEGFGGGIDIHATKLLAFRPIQVDYIHTRFNSAGQNNFRISLGVVFNF